MQIQQIIRCPASAPENHTRFSVLILAFMSMCTFFSPLAFEERHDKQDLSFVPPLGPFEDSDV